MRTVVFGEILWDVFGNDRRIGGAPFNFAAHMAKLGADVELISAVGHDDNGTDALADVARLGISAAHIAVTDYPTGYCLVTLNNGTPEYELVENVAYDNIPSPAEPLSGDAFYFGTLAQRGERSARSLMAALDGNFGEVFFDINIRQHFYNAGMIDRSLRASTIFKISREEIGVLGISGSPEYIARQIANKYQNLCLIIVTLDKDGAFAYDCRAEHIIYSPKPQSAVVSTVGAGDSFSACFLYNYLRGAEICVCLERAVALSDYVVTQLGAVPDYPAELLRRIL